LFFFLSVQQEEAPGSVFGSGPKRTGGQKLQRKGLQILAKNVQNIQPVQGTCCCT
jgi:hypothetical protein